MKPQHQQTRHLLDSAPAHTDTTTTTTTPNGDDEEETNSNNNSNGIVKIMEKESHVFVVDKLPSRLNIGIGDSIESNPFEVGSKGYSFTIQLFPHGYDPESHNQQKVSVFIKNHSRKTAHVVLGLQMLLLGSFDDTGRSSFHDRKTYHQVAVLEPGQDHGIIGFTSYVYLRSIFSPNGCVKIKATIGLVHLDAPPPKSLSLSLSSSFEYERHRCILFKVGDRHFYAQDSVVTTRCPPLLSDYPQSNHIVLISDVDPDVFEAVLWFLHNNNYLHEQDRKAIANSNDSFAVRILAAADKFKLKDLTRQCQSLVYYGNSELFRSYYEMESDVKELWGYISRLSQKMKELIPQKMKAA